MITRRGFLRTVGAATASLSIGRLLGSTRAFAQAGEHPLRFIAMFTPHGCVQDYWRPQATSGPHGFTVDYADSVLRPLQVPDAAAGIREDLRDRLLRSTVTELRRSRA